MSRSKPNLAQRAPLWLALFAATGAAWAQQPGTPAYERKEAAVHRAEAGRALGQALFNNHGQVVAGALRVRGRDEATLAALRDAGVVPGRDGVTHHRFEQTVDGLPLYGAYAKAAFRANGELIHLIDHLAGVSTQPARASQINARHAVEAAMRRVHVGVPVQFRSLGGNGNAERFDGGAFFHSAPEANEVAIPHADGSVSRGWLVQLWTQKKNLLDHVLVGSDGAVLNIERRTASDSYKVFPIDPVRSINNLQTTVAGPAASTSAPSRNGWLGTGTQLTTSIVGNNVGAYLDVDANNRIDAGGTSVTGGNFLATANLTTAPTGTTNRAVAVQNLFYLNNVIHDILYRHGFNEAAGNFQSNNFKKGGRGNDPVNAEAQDGSGTDNANFSTPGDGQRPRMQMYLWNGPGPTHEVVVGAANYGAKGAEFGPALTATGLTGSVVVANDGSTSAPAGATGTISDACQALTSSAVSGKIVLADRGGGCSFKTKARNAAAAGATGLVVANNTSAWPLYFAMGDDTAITTTITIPSVMISQADGAALRNATTSATMRKKAVQPLQIDAALDSDIVYHEYCHGLTWRMIGGMSGLMAGAIGEGMSDGCAILINGVQNGSIDYTWGDKVGEYSAGDAAPGGFQAVTAATEPVGIRSKKYAGYSSSRTYADVKGDSGVHFDGEVYGAIVWRMLELFGPENRDRLFAYVVDGMNYTNSTPKFETMRDGILAAVNAKNASTEAADACNVWRAFAQLGVGVGASSTVTSTAITTVPSFTAPSTCN
jgi:extracellular elastinolytic metalloproteinase